MPGKGEGSLHLYHGSIWLRTDCNLELSSFEMPVQANKAERWCGCSVLLSQSKSEASTEPSARLAGDYYVVVVGGVR